MGAEADSVSSFEPRLNKVKKMSLYELGLEYIRQHDEVRDDEKPLDQPQSAGGTVRSRWGREVDGVCGNRSRSEDLCHRHHLLRLLHTVALPAESDYYLV